ncbi:hypothetical protein ACTFNM_01910 [Bacillus cereus group sp. BCN115]|uniref:hypothetical protein n=1 Tax=Bacillus cereus group sp. BCN115 TaxID=3450575 RepID=UPI003F7B26CA
MGLTAEVKFICFIKKKRTKFHYYFNVKEQPEKDNCSHKHCQKGLLWGKSRLHLVLP